MITLPIIAYHRSPLSQKFGTPRQPNLVAVPSQLEFVAPYDVADAFVGLDEFSHLWVLWQFHHNKPQDHFRPQVRPPRLGGNDKTGVFATRSMYRPSGLGLSVVKLEKIDHTANGHGTLIHISGADMIDGTPIVDIKPYLPYSDSLATATSPISTPLLKAVMFGDTAKADFEVLVQRGVLLGDELPIIANLIAQDPRVAYRQSEIGVMSVMRYGAVDVGFLMNEGGGLVVEKVWVVNELPCVDL